MPYSSSVSPVLDFDGALVLARGDPACYSFAGAGDWLSWLERVLHTDEVTGSSPVSPTTSKLSRCRRQALQRDDKRAPGVAGRNDLYYSGRLLLWFDRARSTCIGASYHRVASDARGPDDLPEAGRIDKGALEAGQHVAFTYCGNGGQLVAMPRLSREGKPKLGAVGT